jgi:hypothetical protein
LRRKYTFKAHGRQVVFVKQYNESHEHVFMKALLWALYLPIYPVLKVEYNIGDRFKPDVVQLDAQGMPQFWGEAGHVGVRKIEGLVRRYPSTHFALAKWATGLQPFVELVSEALAGVRRRHAPFDLLCFPTGSAERFIDGAGQIQIQHEDVEWIRLAGEK